MDETNKNLELEFARMREELANAQAKIIERDATIDDLHSTIESFHNMAESFFTLNMTESMLDEAFNTIKSLKIEMADWTNGPELSMNQRRILQGASQRRYGFIDEISDVMSANPQFIPSNIIDTEYKEDIRKFEIIRNINIALRQVLRVTEDIQLVMGDNLYRSALSYYGSVRDAALRRVEGAKALFDSLRVFFKSMRRRSGEPTEHEALRDARALIHGRKDGEIIISNEADHVVKGERTIIDETHKQRAGFKETESGEIN